MHKIKTLTAILVTASLGTSTLRAVPPGGPGPRGPGRPGTQDMGRQHPGRRSRPPLPGPRELEKAGADEDQIEAITEFAFAQQQKRIDLEASVEKAELALERLLHAPAVEEEAVMEAVDILNQARGDLFKLDIISRVKVKQILGEEVLRTLREQGPPPGRGDRGHGPGGHPGPHPDEYDDAAFHPAE